MRKYCIPQPQRVRRIEKSFAWIDHRLLRNGYLPVMTHQDQALYLFLALAADRHGVSFYRKEKICDLLDLDWGQFEICLLYTSQSPRDYGESRMPSST